MNRKGTLGESRVLRLVAAALLALALHAETGYDMWLRYSPNRAFIAPASIFVASDSEVIRSAREETIRGRPRNDPVEPFRPPKPRCPKKTQS